MPSVSVRDNEPFDIAWRRLKRAVEKAGIPRRLREVEFYEKPTSKRKREKAAAVKRWQKKLFKEQEIRMRGRVLRTHQKIKSVTATPTAE